MIVWAIEKRKVHFFIFNTFLKMSPTVTTYVKDCASSYDPPAMPSKIFSLRFALFAICIFSWFSRHINYWSRFSDQPLLSPSLLFLSSYSSLLSCKESVRAFLLYCYLLSGSIVFSKQTHHWHLAVLISASAMCLIGFNEKRKRNFVGKLEKKLQWTEMSVFRYSLKSMALTNGKSVPASSV